MDGNADKTAPAVDRDTLADFLFHEADLLDARDYDAWLALYTADCRYWLPLEEGQESPKTTVSLIYDDRKLLETRIRRMSHPRMHAQAPHSRTVHIVGNVRPAGTTGDGLLIVRSSQAIVEYRQNRNRLFAGQVTHHLAPGGEGYKIALKRIDLVDSEGEHRGIPILL